MNTNFTDIINGTSDGTKDFSINALTVAGAAALNGNVDLGNATGDTITFNGRVDSDIDPSASATYALGSTSLAYTGIFLDNGATDGGAVYFNASATAFIKSDASAGDLDISGFTDVDFNSVNLKGSGNYTFTGTMSHDGAAVFNESGADVDFRIEGDTLTHLFFVDASTDRIGINNSSPSQRLHVTDNNNGDLWIQTTNTNTGSSARNGIQFEADNGNFQFFRQGSGNSAVGAASAGVVANGSGGVYMTLNGTSWTSTSDMRLKTRLDTFVNGLSKLMHLDAFTYHLNNDKEKTVHLGMSAQQVMETIPEVVAGVGGDGPLGINYDRLVPVLVNAIQELNAKVNGLEARA